MNAPESAKLYDPGLESTRERADLLASSGDDAPKTPVSYTHLTLPTKRIV